ncbi:hypothetical protein BDY19DRAFT_902099 [Irpex rosettiformis]|uniref:Uncharacterized protein n=1 Tax=Irpex rosettiformis TaxID=378272 RepID=A0ACB8ULN6_9APHY|nr:hypothetical protein BDY19DRAFT_902099 [Irpex rosettiformis]
MGDTHYDMTKEKAGTAGTLDVEDEESRQQRLHDVFMDLDKSSTHHAQNNSRSFDFGDRKTFMVEPPSELLSRIQAFLPEFAASTAELTRRAEEDPDSVDIEKLQSEGPYIRMDLGLGVFEERKSEPSCSTNDSDTEMQDKDATRTSSSSSSSSNSDSRSDSNSSDEYDSDDSIDIISSTMSTFQYNRPIRPLPRRRSTQPGIVVLGERGATSPVRISLALGAGRCVFANTTWPPCPENANWFQTSLMNSLSCLTASHGLAHTQARSCFDVKITYDIPLTILSVIVAIVFAFAAFTTAYISDVLQKKPLFRRLLKWKRSYSTLRSVLFTYSPGVDVESGRRSHASSGASEERHPMLISSSDSSDNDEYEYREENEGGPHPARGHTPLGPIRTGSAEEAQNTEDDHPTLVPPSQGLLFSDVLWAPLRLFSCSCLLLPSSDNHNAAIAPTSAWTSEDSTPVTTNSSDDSTFTIQRFPSSSAQSAATTPMSLLARPWNDPLHAGLSRETRLRIKAHVRDKPMPKFGWKYWLKRYYSSISLLVFVRAGIWGLAIVFMHYCGRPWYSPWQVTLLTDSPSFVLTLRVLGMRAASFYTKPGPSDHPGYPAFLPFSIPAVAAFVCVVSNAVLAHSAIISRNHVAEVILTKRRKWCIMAEKEAAEQASLLKQQFISVASHEIRTSLHAVNSYCNVLDFSKQRARKLDETFTYRILMNLLSNAQKFCEEVYICVHVFMDTPSQVALELRDTGCGIPKFFRHALFQPFRLADSSLTQPKQGTGLGLSIVKHLVERMSGSIEVESAESEGSTFTVRLPITMPSSPSSTESDTKLPKRRLKIIHRSDRTAQLLADMWTRLGLATVVFSHGGSLSDLLKDTDAIVTDVESVQRSPSLIELINAEQPCMSPPVHIVHSNAQELSALEPKLPQAHGIILVKRPIVAHALLDTFSNPAPHPDPEALSHKVNQRLGRRFLEQLGYEVETADNDCQMPVLDGFAATTRIRELENNGTIHGRIAIIALAANVDVDSEEKCRVAGMDPFLPNPFKLSGTY